MSETAQFILEFVVAAGGITTYPEVYEATPYEKRRLLPNAKKELKAQGLLKENVEMQNGAVVHQLIKL
jgi:hypothetical protein